MIVNIMDAYNKKLLGKLKHNLSFVKHEHKGKDAYVLYLKSGKQVNGIDDTQVLGFITTDKLGDKYDSVYQSVAVPGVGNILYAMVTMSVTSNDRLLCCNQEGDLRDEAQDLWYRIRDNKHYQSEWLPLDVIYDGYLTYQREDDESCDGMTNAEYFEHKRSEDGDSPTDILYAAYACQPDYGYTLVAANHAKSGMNTEVLEAMIEDADTMFWTAFNVDEDYDGLDLNRTNLAENDFSGLLSFVEKSESNLSM